MLDNSDHNLYSINKEISNLNDKYNKNIIINSLLINIKDKKKLERVLKYINQITFFMLLHISMFQFLKKMFLRLLKIISMEQKI